MSTNPLKPALGVLDAVVRRRTVRVFRPYREVEDIKLAAILEAARRASHWGNLGATEAVVVRRSSAPAALLQRLDSPTGAVAMRTAPVILVWLTNPQTMDHFRERQEELVTHSAFGVDATRARRRIERLLVPLVLRRRTKLEASGLFELDAGQAVAQATLAAVHLGLGSCLCAVTDAPKLRVELNLPNGVRVLIAQAIGYPLESTDVPPRPRRSFGELFHDARYGEPLRIGPRERAQLGEVFDETSLPPEWRVRELEWLSTILGDHGRLL